MLFLTLYLQNLDIKFLSEILDLYLDFIKFTVGKMDFDIQVVPNILKSFLVIEFSVHFKFEFQLIKFK